MARPTREAPCWRFAILVPLVAWAVVAVWSLVRLFEGYDDFTATAVGSEAQLQRWSMEFKLAIIVTIVLGIWVVWSAALVVAWGRHVRQWGTVCVFSAVTLVVWFFALGSVVRPGEMAEWVDPGLVKTALWTTGATGLYVVVVAALMIRHSPSPVDQRYDRYTLTEGGYMPFNRPGQPNVIERPLRAPSAGEDD
jgi:hypothetical protein